MTFIAGWSGLGLAVVFVIYRFYLYPTLLSPLRHIPHARADWHFRLYEWVYTEPDPIRINSWVARTPHNGLVRYTGIGGIERIIPLSSEAVKDVFVTNAYSCFEKSRLTKERARTMLGNGLLALDDDQHQVHKRRLLPAFAFRHIRPLYSVFWAKACELGDVLDSVVASSKAVALRTYTSHAALDIIGVAAWGKDFDALKNPDSEVVKKYGYIQHSSPAAKKQARLIYAAALVVSMKTLARWFPCKYFQEVAEGIRAVRIACRQAIALKRAELKAGDTRSHDILSVALSNSEFDDEALTGHMLNILAAGHETSSLTVKWACYLLSRHPAIQTRLRDEVRSTLPSPYFSDDGTRSDVSAEVLDSMPLLRAVIRETLRVIPPVPLLRREASKDTTVIGYPVPAGTNVTSMAWVIHKSISEWGPDAAEFKPDRWLREGQEALGGARSTFSNLSFSAGPRSCIGEGFAKAEAQALLAVLVGKFNFQLTDEFDREVEDLSLLWGITVKCVDMRFKMQPIDGW